MPLSHPPTEYDLMGGAYKNYLHKGPQCEDPRHSLPEDMFEMQTQHL